MSQLFIPTGAGLVTSINVQSTPVGSIAHIKRDTLYSTTVQTQNLRVPLYFRKSQLNTVSNIQKDSITARPYNLMVLLYFQRSKLKKLFTYLDRRACIHQVIKSLFQTKQKSSLKENLLADLVHWTKEVLTSDFFSVFKDLE